MTICGKICLAVVAFAFLAAAIGYFVLPEKIATHWSLQGTPDAFSGKEVIFVIPAIALTLVALMWLVPEIDPLKKNIEKFKAEYHGYVIAFTCFMVYLELIVIAFNLGWIQNLCLWIAPAFAILLYSFGLVMEKSAQNWFFGIANPWTLSSSRVWKKTNRLGGKVSKAVAMLYLAVAVMAPEKSLPFLLLVSLAALVGLFAYSYLEWRNEKKRA